MKEIKDVNFYVESPSINEPNWIPIAKWVRVRFGNEIIADSKKVMLKRPYPLVYYFPKADVKMEFLDKSGKKDEEGDWGAPELYNVKTEDNHTDDAAFSYEEPSGEAPDEIKDFIAFKWNKMDAWLEMENIIWTYPFPNNNVMKIKNLLAFFTEKLDDVFIDGERLPKVNTKWR